LNWKICNIFYRGTNILMVTWCEKVKNLKKKVWPPHWPQISVKTPFAKKENMIRKNVSDSLNTYSHNEPYDLQAQVIFQKKSLWWQKTSNQTHTFLESITTTNFTLPIKLNAKKRLRDFSTKIQFLQYGDFKFNNIVEKFLKYNIAITGKKGTSTVQKKTKKCQKWLKLLQNGGWIV